MRKVKNMEQLKLLKYQLENNFVTKEILKEKIKNFKDTQKGIIETIADHEKLGELTGNIEASEEHIIKLMTQYKKNIQIKKWIDKL